MLFVDCPVFSLLCWLCCWFSKALTEHLGWQAPETNGRVFDTCFLGRRNTTLIYKIYITPIVVFKIESTSPGLYLVFFNEEIVFQVMAIVSTLRCPLGPWPLSNRAALHISTLGHMKTERLCCCFTSSFFWICGENISQQRSAQFGIPT